MEQEVKHRTVKSLISKLSSVSEQTRTSALCELRQLTKNDPQIRPIIAEEDEGAAISLVAETLYSTTPLAQENAAATLLNLSITCKHMLITTHGVLDALAFALSNHRTYPAAAVQSAAATIYSLCIEQDYRRIVGGKRDIVYALIDIVGFKESSSRSIKDGLKALFGLSLCHSYRPLLVEFGAVDALFGVVVRDFRVGVIEDVTAVIAQIAACQESLAAFRRVSGVRALVDLLSLESGSGSGSSTRIRENAVSGLLNQVRVGGEEVGEDVREVGLGLVFDGLGEVIDSGSEKGRNRALALMKILEEGMSIRSTSLKDGNESGSDLYPLSDCSNSFSY